MDFYGVPFMIYCVIVVLIVSQREQIGRILDAVAYRIRGGKPHITHLHNDD